MLDELLLAVFNGVFVHRYRDRDNRLRDEAISPLGKWIVGYPQKLLDEMIVDEGPEGRELCGGLVMFHRTNRRDGPAIGKRIPKEGDECVIRWRERYTSGMNVSDGDEPCVIGTQTWVADELSDDASGDGAARGAAFCWQ